MFLSIDDLLGTINTKSVIYLIHVYVLISSNVTLLSITEISLDNVISNSKYLRSGTRIFEEENEVKFKQDNKYQLKQCGTPENIPYILARRRGTPEKSTFLDQISRYA